MYLCTIFYARAYMKSIYEWNKYGLIALLLVVNAAFFALMAWVMPIRFEENDDVMMCMIANGTYSGAPDAHLVFINVLYGWVLTLFYRLICIQIYLLMLFQNWLKM